MAIERLEALFATMLDKLGDMLMARGDAPESHEDGQLNRDARTALARERANLLVEFNKRLRGRVDDRLQAKTVKADFSKLDVGELTLVDHQIMDESVITGNILRVIENSAHDQLITFNRGIANLLDQPGLETGANPLSPMTFVEAFAASLSGVNLEDKLKFQILKVLNQASLHDFVSVYADLNKHLTQLGVMPAALRAPQGARKPCDKSRPHSAQRPGSAAQGSAEVDVMSLCPACNRIEAVAEVAEVAEVAVEAVEAVEAEVAAAEVDRADSVPAILPAADSQARRARRLRRSLLRRRDTSPVRRSSRASICTKD